MILQLPPNEIIKAQFLSPSVNKILQYISWLTQYMAKSADYTPFCLLPVGDPVLPQLLSIFKWVSVSNLLLNALWSFQRELSILSVFLMALQLFSTCHTQSYPYFQDFSLAAPHLVHLLQHLFRFLTCSSQKP